MMKPRNFPASELWKGVALAVPLLALLVVIAVFVVLGGSPPPA
jgi:hypothetical protein